MTNEKHNLWFQQNEESEESEMECVWPNECVWPKAHHHSISSQQDHIFCVSANNFSCILQSTSASQPKEKQNYQKNLNKKTPTNSLSKPILHINNGYQD